jgi:hypothetical protein
LKVVTLTVRAYHVLSNESSFSVILVAQLLKISTKVARTAAEKQI